MVIFSHLIPYSDYALPLSLDVAGVYSLVVSLTLIGIKD